MKLEIQANTRYGAALVEFIRFKRITIAEALRFEGRQLALLLIKLTPPRSRAQGRAAVARDIRRSVRPISRPSFKDESLNKSIRDLVRKKDYSGLQTVFDRIGIRVRVKPFTPALHKGQQKSRGRVSKETDVVSPDVSEIKSYISKIQKNVGGARGGWADAAIRLGGGVAGWITAHRNQGAMTDRAADPFGAYIRMENRSKWAEGGDEDRIVANAIQTRITAIPKAIAHAIEKAKLRAAIK